MTKFTKIIVSSAFVLSLPAIALSNPVMDADGDGLLTIAEVQAAMPEVTTDQFNALDANADGALDADEVKAAQDAGALKTDG